MGRAKRRRGKKASRGRRGGARLRPVRALRFIRRMKRRQLRGFDLKQIRGVQGLIGVDEVGRGAFAGPVVAAAVLVTRDFLESRWAVAKSGRVNDSKALSAAEREDLWAEFEQLAAQGLIHAQPGAATVEEIEQLNILGATKLAMRRALGALYPPEAFEPQRDEPDLFSSFEERKAFAPAVSARVLVDGLPLRNFPYPHQAFVRGDGRSLCIAMASIVAKVTRDRTMTDLDAKYPGYGFARHVRTVTDERAGIRRADAVYTISPALPRGSRTIDA